MIFDPEQEYPINHLGQYADLEGTVLSVTVGVPIYVEVETSEETITGVWDGDPDEVQEGYTATVRIYNTGTDATVNPQIISVSAGE